MGSGYLELALLLIFAAVAVYAAYMIVLAMIAIACDTTVSSAQKAALVVLNMGVPILGALLVLHAASHHIPVLVNKLPLGWPLRRILYGKSLPAHREAGIDDVWDDIP